MDFLSATTTDDVIERHFVLVGVPGALFSPAGAHQAGPLVLLAHGGGQSAAHLTTLARARRYAGALGLSVLALDAPGHGGRPRSPALEAAIAALPGAMASGAPGAAVAALNAEVAAAAVPEWRAVLHAVLESGHARTPVGLVGLSMGAATAVPLLAAEPRITAAVIGLVGARGLAEHAARISAAVQVVVQWDDELVERADALALFAAIGSKEKSLHANPGGHAGVPAAEHESTERFLIHHLLDVEASTISGNSEPAPRGGQGGQRLRRGVVLRAAEESCEVLVAGQRVVARYAGAFPSPRTERVAPGHLVALATAGALCVSLVVGTGMVPISAVEGGMEVDHDDDDCKLARAAAGWGRERGPRSAGPSPREAAHLHRGVQAGDPGRVRRRG